MDSATQPYRASARRHADAEAPGTRQVNFCSKCEKPFTSDRHVKYCAKRIRNRPRSCRACKQSKVKCTFESECSRCLRKGIDCAYDDSALLSNAGSEPDGAAGSDSRALSPAAKDKLSMAKQASLGSITLDDLFDATPAYQDSFMISALPQLPLPTAWNPLGWLLPATNCSPPDFGSVPTNPTAQYDVIAQDSDHWCTWANHGLSLSDAIESSLVRPTGSQLAVVQGDRPHAQYCANLATESLRSIPLMMSRKKTLPWFVHTRSLSAMDGAAPSFPDSLSACMSLAQLFDTRTTDTRPFLWRAIRIEHQGFVQRKSQMSQYQLLAAVQASMIYLIMFIIDYSPEYEEDSRELLLALHELTISLKGVCGGRSSENEFLSPSATWEDWIFAESRRRLVLLWFLIGCVVCTKTRRDYDPTQSYRNIPLPGPQSLWEATSSQEWQAEYDTCHLWQPSGLVVLGDLLDAQQAPHLASQARKLDRWNARLDTLGSLLNLVGGML